MQHEYGKDQFRPNMGAQLKYTMKCILEYLPGYRIIIIISVRTASLSHDVYYQSLLLTSANLHVHTQKPIHIQCTKLKSTHMYTPEILP